MALALAPLAALAAGPAATPAPGEADQELLENLDLLVDWELLQEWDPADGLPVPVDAEAPSPGIPEEKPR